MLEGKLILFRGAGDFATGSIRRLHVCGARVIAAEVAKPLTIRRTAAFSEAVWNGRHTVEGVTAVRCLPEEADGILDDGFIPVLIDPELKSPDTFAPDAIIDGRMLKSRVSYDLTDSPIIIGLGPGFEVGVNCHAAVETLAGPDIGRVIYEGSAAVDTGTPGFHDKAERTPCCCGFDINTLVIRAPESGVFEGTVEITSPVLNKQEIGAVISGGRRIPVTASSDGILRGVIHSEVTVAKGVKIADIDPSGDAGRCFLVSEKSNAIAGGVLEACGHFLRKAVKV